MDEPSDVKTTLEDAIADWLVDYMEKSGETVTNEKFKMAVAFVMNNHSNLRVRKEAHDLYDKLDEVFSIYEIRETKLPQH